MSGWNNFKASVRGIAQKASEKTEDLADTAALRLRASEARNQLEEAYEGLGKLMYIRLREGSDNTTDIDAVLTRIDTLRHELETIEARIAAKQSAKQSAKQAKEENAAESSGAEENPSADADTTSTAD